MLCLLNLYTAQLGFPDNYFTWVWLVFVDLEHVIQHNFLSNVFTVEISTTECNLFALPLQCGELGMSTSVSLASCLYMTSNQVRV